MGGDTQVFDQKIRNKMLVRILITAAAILLALAMVTYWITRAVLAEELKTKSRNKVELVASHIERWLEKRGEVMTLLAQREGRQPTSVEFKEGYFREIARRYGGVESAYIGYPDGEFVSGADQSRLPADYDPRKRPWYQNAERERDITFSSPYVDALTHRMVTTVAVPVERDGGLLAVLGMDIFIDDLMEKVESIKIGEHSRAYVVDSDGLFIAHPDSERILEGNVGSTEDATYFEQAVDALSAERHYEDRLPSSSIFEGDDDYVIVSRIRAPDWYLFFHLPKNQVNAPLSFLAVVFVVGIIGALFILAVTVNYISSRIAEPILVLADGARHIADGDYERRLMVSSRDEVGYLTKSFNDMAEGLEEREFIRTTFGRYVSQDVMQDILDGNLELGGQTREVTILFSDIRDFTKLSESMAATELVDLLNKFFERMDVAITGAGGSINKYLGDGILAMFGAPNRLDNCALSAVEAARDMLRVQLLALNEDTGLDLRVGIGIHTGDAVVGNIGSRSRTEYTTIGDAVNTASRIEGLSKRYGEALLCSEDTAVRLSSDEWLLRTIDRVRVVGKSMTTPIYAPYRADYASDERAQRIERSNAIMDRYFDSDFEGALKLLDELDDLDRHLTLIRQRCIEFRTKPPIDWDGSYTMDRK